jgi:cation-transporting ATPase E
VKLSDDVPMPVNTRTSLQGLTAAEVAARVARGQVNRPPRSAWAEYRTIFARNLFTLFNALVVPAAIALFLLGDLAAAWAVSGMAVINTVIGLAQEIRAKRHLDKLAILAETRARVLRDGEACVIPAGDVVLDDRVLLTAGEPVVADGTVLEARFLEVDEALLTGESDLVPHQPGDCLLSGSFCVAGEGAYRAVRVGGEAFAQQTSAEARRYRFTASPLQRTIDTLIRILTALTLVLCGLYLGLYFLRGFGDDDLVRMVAATVTSMVPQGLVLMTTLAFTLGAVRMSHRGAVVQRLNAVESMAAVDVLCMDKTGTLTTSHLSLDRVHALDNPGEEEVRRRLRLFAWASVDERNKSIQALRAALGALPDGAAVELLDQVPFKSQNRYSAVRVRRGTEQYALALGAFEALRPFLAGDAAVVEAAWHDLLPTRLRLLLFAGVNDNPMARSFNGSLEGCVLRPLALVALSDELRPEAGAVLEALAAQGVRFKILSGDNPETVRATVGHLKLPLAAEPVVTGDQLAAAADRAEVIRDRSVFGRIAPRQKLEIITTLQAQGRRVAMIGDGVNDILPIKKADLGIAMGEGSAATRTVAGLVLENNSFELLPATLDEGRTILRNVRRAAKLFLLKNVYTLFLILVAFGSLGLGFPYRPQQVTLLNFLTIGVPAFLIMLGKHPPATPIRRGFLGEAGWFAISSGLVMGLAGLAVWLIAAWGDGADEQTQRTLLLSTLIVLGLGAVLRLMADAEGGPEAGDRRLRTWTLLALPLYLAIMYVPPAGYLADGTPLSAAWFFRLSPLSLAQWGLVVTAAVPALALCLVLDRVGRRWQVA